MDLFKMHPYANSFRTSGDAAENKYEIDSVCYTIKLGYRLWKQSRDSKVLGGDQFLSLVQGILAQWSTERQHDNASAYRHSEFGNNGLGTPTKPNIGLIWTGFRASDDQCIYHYNIPENMMAAVSLDMIEEMLLSVYKDYDQMPALVKEVKRLRLGIHNGIHKYGRGESESNGEIYAYEVDGYGGQIFMDDANLPSLLSIPYIGYDSPHHSTQKLYTGTRAFVLSDANPYYYRGSKASGMGSAHTGKGCVWHLGLIAEGLTATSKAEKLKLLATIHSTTGGTGLLHESFLAGDPETYTRGWFGWASSLFCELVEQVVQMPHHH